MLTGTPQADYLEKLKPAETEVVVNGGTTTIYKRWTQGTAEERIVRQVIVVDGDNTNIKLARAFAEWADRATADYTAIVSGG